MSRIARFVPTVLLVLTALAHFTCQTKAALPVTNTALNAQVAKSALAAFPTITLSTASVNTVDLLVSNVVTDGTIPTEPADFAMTNAFRV